ncbi:MAG: UDP-3-O-(3-hydroxymyristoyl)glucosamine N-acyltransferase [bacterium]
MVEKYKLNEIAKKIDAEVMGDGDIEIISVGSLNSAGKGYLTFLTGSNIEAAELAVSRGAVVICRQGLKLTPSLQVEDPYFGFIQAMGIIKPESRPSAGIDSTAQIAKTAKLGHGVFIGSFCQIGENAVIGDGAVIQAFSFIGREVEIGQNSWLKPRVSLLDRTVVGNRVIIHSGAVLGSDGFGYHQTSKGIVKIPQVGRVVVEDDVEIGANTTIDRAMLDETRIGAGTKIDNLVQIAHNVIIGKNCLIASQVGISGSTTVGNNVIMAGQVGVADHVNIGNKVTILAKSGISGHIPDNQVVLWIPAMEVSRAKRMIAAVRMLPDFIKKINKLEKQIKSSQQSKI